jgi:hypothetical protein
LQPEEKRVTEPWWEQKAATFERLGWPALAGLLLLPVGIWFEWFWVSMVGLFLTLPWFLYVYLMTIWHWKARYRGEHSELWGALLLIEVSGWFKIIYLLRHIVPDWRGRGRYARQRTAAGTVDLAPSVGGAA